LVQPDYVTAGADLHDSRNDWITAHEALDLVRRRNRDGGGAISIATRAHAGLIQTRARLFLREVAGPYGRKEEVSAEDEELPKAFWWANGHGALDSNWDSGDFSTWIDKKYHWQAFGVEFGRQGIEAMLAPLVPDLAIIASALTVPPKAMSGGRRPANWWPDFAEELAVYIHDEGLPPGNDADGQNGVIDAVFKRMNERGKQEGGRTTVQPVVAAVLRRARSAEN